MEGKEQGLREIERGGGREEEVSEGFILPLGAAAPWLTAIK